MNELTLWFTMEALDTDKFVNEEELQVLLEKAVDAVIEYLEKKRVSERK